MASSDQSHEFDVSLCYANEDKGYVTSIHGVLDAFGIRALEDEFSESRLRGAVLNELDIAYRDRSRLTVAFISEHYARKQWTAPEEFAAQIWAFNELGSRFIALGLDDASLAGLSSSPYRLDNRDMDIAKAVTAIKERLDLLAEQPALLAADTPRLSLPDGPERRQQLLRELPPGWRAALKASIMREGIEHLESKWYDHQLGLRKLPGLHFRRNEAARFLQGHVLPELQAMIQAFSAHVGRNSAIEGTGDPDAIEEYAREFVALYEALLDWAARIRGSSVPPNWNVMIQTSAQLVDALLVSVREFVASYARLAEDLLNDTNGDGTARDTLTLKFDLDSALLDTLLVEYKKVHQG